MEERLRKFARLVDAGSFTRAALDLHISQPALSAAISKLERELHAKLLVRSSRSLRLTESGKLAYAAAKELGMRTYNLKLQLAELARAELSFSIGMIDSVASVLFSAAASIDELERRAKVSIVVNNSRYLLRAIEHDELDLAFIAEPPKPLPITIESTYVAAEPLVLVCHASKHEVTSRALRHNRLPHFVSYDQASTTFGLISNALQSQGIAPEPTLFSTSPEVMLRLVALQKGTAMLPYPLVKDLLNQKILALPGNPSPIVIARRITAIKRREKLLAAPLLKTVEQLQDLLDKYLAEANDTLRP